MESPAARKSFLFALRIIGLYKKLSFEKKEFILSKQVLRSGTSIGANIAESEHAQSRADFTPISGAGVRNMPLSQSQFLTKRLLLPIL